MQYHLNGFTPGDLQVSEPVRGLPEPVPATELPAEVDVLIVGCGPAGLTLARQLSEHAAISTCVVDLKAGPMLFGQADGISCRTIEIMEAFNCSDTVVKEAYWLNQNAFWEPDAAQPEHIRRAHKVADARLGLSEFTHSVVNQARIHDLLLVGMKQAPAQLVPTYNRRLVDVHIDREHTQDLDRPVVTARFERIDDDSAAAETVRARFIVACDGARSTVRRNLDIALQGDSANKAWGVMDALVVTDFPDIRVKTFIQSSADGAVMIVPREGGYLVRLYVELELLNIDERVANLDIGADDIIAAAQRIMRPYTLEVKEVAWWSKYEVGQRVAERFDDTPVDDQSGLVPRAFLTGDACHTHSPKAGQGLNVSLQDAFNLGWKLAAVLTGTSAPALLNTYASERRSVALQLIELDKKMSDLVATQPVAQEADAPHDATDTGDIEDYIATQNGFIAGTTIEYRPSIIRSEGEHQHLARGFEIGRRFHSAKATRIAVGRPLHLGHLIKADGRWRVFVFGDEHGPTNDSSDTYRLAEFLASDPSSPILRKTPPGGDQDSVIDLYGVFQQHNIAIEDLPELWWPAKGTYGLRDYEKAFHTTETLDIFEERSIDRRGCIVVARPDQHVATVLPLTAHAELASFFDAFMTEQPVCIEH